MSNMFCSNCGAQLNPNAQFCTSCGTPVNPANMAGNMASGNMASAPFSPQAQFPNQNQYPQKNKSKMPLIIVSACAAVLLIVVIVLLVGRNNNSPSNNDFAYGNSGYSSSNSNSNNYGGSGNGGSTSGNSNSGSSGGSSYGGNNSGNSSQTSASTPESALDNFFNGLNAMHRNATLNSLHPIYKTVISNTDDSFIYDFFCDLATSDMYLTVAETLGLAYAEDLDLSINGYSITGEWSFDSETLSDLNELLGLYYDYFLEEYNIATPSSSSWKVDSGVYYEINFRYSAYGEPEDTTNGEVYLVKVSGQWYVLIFDF